MSLAAINQATVANLAPAVGNISQASSLGLRTALIALVRFAAAPAIFVMQRFSNITPVSPSVALASLAIWLIAGFALRTFFAQDRSIHHTLPNNPTLINAVKHLPRENSQKQFVYRTKLQIETLDGGICLTPSPDLVNPGLFDYDGIVVSQENSRWILHICPGGGYGEFSEEDFNRLMPIAINELHRRNITPVAFVIDGRHPGDTLQNFERWKSRL